MVIIIEDLLTKAFICNIGTKKEAFLKIIMSHFKSLFKPILFIIMNNRTLDFLN